MEQERAKSSSCQSKSIQGKQHANIYARANAKKCHVRRCTNAEEDLGAPGKNAAEKSHAVTAVWLFAKTGRKKGKMALYQRNSLKSLTYQ